MSNLNKCTKAELIKIVEATAEVVAANKILAQENEDLRSNLAAASEMILKLGGIKQLTEDPKEKVRMDDARIGDALAWIFSQAQVSLAGVETRDFQIYKTRDGSWAGVEAKGYSSTFWRDLVTGMRQAGWNSNYWGAQGFYFSKK